MTRRILALVLGMLYIRISRLTAWLATKTWGHNYKQVDAYIDANHAYPPLDEAWVFPGCGHYFRKPDASAEPDA